MPEPVIHLAPRKPGTPATTKTNLVGGNLPAEFHWDPAARAAEHEVTPGGAEIEQSPAKVPQPVPVTPGSNAWVKANEATLTQWENAYNAALESTALGDLGTRWGRRVTLDEASLTPSISAELKRLEATPKVKQSAALAADRAVPQAALWRMPGHKASAFFPSTEPDAAEVNRMILSGGASRRLSFDSEKVPTYRQPPGLVDYSTLPGKTPELNLKKALYTTSQ
ncbi:MAG TPA: hypothetical protein VGU43_07460 [Thermoplasmata archaeon]|nr:hypothetical protein [Thermoplasmata archaeon]